MTATKRCQGSPRLAVIVQRCCSGNTAMLPRIRLSELYLGTFPVTYLLLFLFIGVLG